MNIQQFLLIFFLWSEMKDFARLSKIGLSNIWKETRKEEISFHGWMLTAFAGLVYAKMCECKCLCVRLYVYVIEEDNEKRAFMHWLLWMLLHFFFTFIVDIRTYYLYSLLHHSMSDFRSKSKKTKGAKNAIRLGDHSSKINIIWNVMV